MGNEIKEELPAGFDQLESFLDTDDYKVKQDILERMLYTEVDPIVINNMAASMDVVLPEGDTETMMRSLLSCVRARAKFDFS